MSYLLKILFICGCIVAVCIQCEDTKNQEDVSLKKQSSEQTIGVKSKSKLTPTPQDTITIPKKIKKITPSNVVSFLTDYGKRHQQTKVAFTTPYGTIVIQLFKDTPLHRANFIYLVKQGYFNTTYFHRVVSNFIIQAGRSDNASSQKQRYAIGHTYRIPNEIKHKHFYGSISGAKYYRDNDDHKSEPFEFFIFLGPKTATSHLDGNYTVFGKVIQGMDVATKISKLAKDAREWPLKNVTIKATLLP
ncbi:peptidylprolyl isomerase [Flavobacteriaceae bacterium]|nr:peptidylprolyl isomerase [Flavobacteriaceae bacterium]